MKSKGKGGKRKLKCSEKTDFSCSIIVLEFQVRLKSLRSKLG